MYVCVRSMYLYEGKLNNEEIDMKRSFKEKGKEVQILIILAPKPRITEFIAKSAIK